MVESTEKGPSGTSKDPVGALLSGAGRAEVHAPADQKKEATKEDKAKEARRKARLSVLRLSASARTQLPSPSASTRLSGFGGFM